MKRKHKALVLIAVILALILVGTAVSIRLGSPADTTGLGSSKTPLGGMFDRARAVSDLKQQMGDLRALYPTLMEFAKAHDDNLPKTIEELRSYLPQKLAYLDDTHWELPTAGKLTPLMNAKESNATVFLQQKVTPPGKARIVYFADGHIEYRK